MEYQKIQTLFKRDDNNIIIPSEYTIEEFNYLKNCKWECTEKVDGTNIRIEVHGLDIEFKGRTERAIIPEHLLKYLKETFTPEKVFTALGVDPKIGCNPNSTCTIYGEGYGVKIQKGGNYIPDGVGFILFDIRIDRWWLKREDLESIASKLGCKIVPIIGYLTIPDAIKYVRKGFKSTIAHNKNYDAEGLVLKTPVGICGRWGERIITKIKTKDFVDFINKYGEKPLKILEEYNTPVLYKYN